MATSKRHRRKETLGMQANRRSLTLEQLEARQLMAADLVVQWNDATIDAIRSDPGSANPGDGSRVFAIVHGAVYDAVNAITKTHSNFVLTTEAPNWASKEAAVATAARDALTGLYPGQVAKFDALWQQALAAIPDGPAENAGVAIGRDAAAAMMTLRTSDGSAGGAPYQTQDGPGHWQVDPLHPNQVAWGPDWGSVTPFAMRYTADFQVPPPPALNSQAYADAYNEVKSLGSLNSTTRTADQTEIGLFWAYDRPVMGPPTVLFNQSVQVIAEAKGNSLEDNARLFALVNVAMADAGVAIWKAKFDYDLWRPITGIREGHTDGNSQTQADPNWIPLGAPGANPNATSDDFTPPFPAYTSGHAGFGAATFQTLARFYGSDNFNYELTSEELPGVTRSYTTFSQAAEENGISRVYLGVHWNFDSTVGQTLGNAIADDVYDRMFMPRQDSTMIEVQRIGGGYRAIVLPAGTHVAMQVDSGVITFVRQDTHEVIFQETAAEVASIRIDGRNHATDFVSIDVSSGDALPESIVVEIVGDQEWFDGVGLNTSDGDDLIVLANNQLSVAGVTPTIYLYGIGYVDLESNDGNDELQVMGVQQGRQINLDGGYGDDQYYVWSMNANLYVADAGGYDGFDFQWLFTPVMIDLAKSYGEHQYLGANTLKLWGDIESLMGSNHADRLYGNHLANWINGHSGDDVIYGRAGNDTLIGNWGNDLVGGNEGDDQIWSGHGDDVVLGGLGHDYIYGGWGRDLLIGSYGSDYLYGEGDDDLLIGGATAYDGNEAALWSIMAEWTCARTRSQRQKNLQYGNGSPGRLNGSNLLTTGYGGTVYDDGAEDLLAKGPGDAWVFNIGKDKVRST